MGTQDVIPQGDITVDPIAAAFLFKQREYGDLLTDYEMGGVALNDSSQGLMVKEWTATYHDGGVYVGAADVPEVLQFSKPGITEVALAFDQNMNPFVAFVDGAGSHFWWFDSTTSQMTFTDLAGTTPRCTLDDGRALQRNTSDIILAYMKGNDLYYRQQRDRYETEYLLKSSAGNKLVTVGMNKGLRLQFQFA